MKIIDSKKIGRCLIMTLETNLPDDFRNHSDVFVEDHVFKDAIIPMSTLKGTRTDISVMFDGFFEVIGKDLKLALR